MNPRIALLATLLVGVLAPAASADLPDLVITKFSVTGRAEQVDKTWRLPVVIEVKNIAPKPADHFRIAVRYALWGKREHKIARFAVKGQETIWVPFNLKALGPENGPTCKIKGHLYLPDELRGKRLVLRAEADARGREGDKSLPDYGRVREFDETNNHLSILYKLEQELLFSAMRER